MAVESSEDLAAMFDPEEHGKTGAWSPIGGGGPFDVDGIFERPFVEALAESEVAGVESTRPEFMCATADLPGVQHGDGLMIEGTAFKIVGIQPDGTGITTLILEDQT